MTQPSPPDRLPVIWWILGLVLALALLVMLYPGQKDTQPLTPAETQLRQREFEATISRMEQHITILWRSDQQKAKQLEALQTQLDAMTQQLKAMEAAIRRGM